MRFFSAPVRFLKNVADFEDFVVAADVDESDDGGTVADADAATAASAASLSSFSFSSLSRRSSSSLTSFLACCHGLVVDNGKR